MHTSLLFPLVMLALRIGAALSFAGPSLRTAIATASSGDHGHVDAGWGGSRSMRSVIPSSTAATPMKKHSNGGCVVVDPPPLPPSSSSYNTGGDAAPLILRRRAFLSKFAAMSLLPMMMPAYAYARGADETGPLVYGSDDIMSPKAHGTTSMPVQEGLRYGVSRNLADKICSFNRAFAEMGGYFESSTSFERDVRDVVSSTGGPVTFYDSVTGSPLFVAPVNRSVDDFIAESKVHGWPSFRDSEVIWDNVRVLKSSGETVSTAGTHLGHNLPDGKGNRYCINLVSVAGNPA